MTNHNGNGLFEGKVRRFFTSLALPVDKGREGECMSCGACCTFFVRCPLLKPVDGKPGTYRCAAYAIRPPQCRKYPRTKDEQIHEPCGFRFEESCTSAMRASGQYKEETGHEPDDGRMESDQGPDTAGSR